MSNKTLVVTILAVFALTGVGWSLLDHAEKPSGASESPTSVSAEDSSGGSDTAGVTDEPTVPIDPNTQTYQNSQYGISFSYIGGDDGYVLVPSPEFGPLSLMLYDADDWADFVKSTDPREGPPGMSADVFLNVDRESASEWIMRGERSNYDRSRGYEKVKIGGYDAVRYGASGLYEMDYAVIGTDRYMYVLSASYFTPEDKIRSDFNALLNSIKISQ